MKQGHQEDIMKLANGKWPSLLVSLGFTELAVSGKHGPCPMCEGKDRFRFMKLDGPGRWICNVCGSNDAMNLVMQVNNMSFAEASKMIRPMIPQADYTVTPQKPNMEEIKAHTKRLMDTWRAAKANDDLGGYLKSRGLKPDTYRQAALRCGTIKHYTDDGNCTGDTLAMLAKITNSKNRTVALHRTYFDLEPREKKITKTVGPMSGGAIRLFKLEGEALIIAEGIETALAARELYKRSGNGTLPAWATVSANGMRNMAFPKQIKKVIIMADNDASYTGQAAAYELASRLVQKEKRQAEVWLPKAVGEDWLDVYRKITEKK